MILNSYENEEKELALLQIGETNEARVESLLAIRKWLQENPKLHAKTDDLSILAFLRGCKFNISKTQQKLKNFYIMKSERTEWFQNRDPNLPEIIELVKLGIFIPLKKFHNNQLVVIIRTAAHNPNIHKQDDVFKVGKMILDIAVKEYFENATIYGVTAILDMKNVTLGHAQQLPPHVIKKAVHAWQNYHCRPKQLEFINAPFYVNIVLKVFKSFMTNKLKKRVNVHFGGIESLHDLISKDILPVEYGGYEDSFQNLIDYWMKKLQEHKSWFEEDEKFKAELL